MKITVEICDSDLKEICRVTGETKKGPAIRKLVTDALLLKRRAEFAQNFISGKWGVELKGLADSRAADNRKATAAATRWRAGEGAGD